MARGLRLGGDDASPCGPTSAFTSVDLPTFGRPTMATMPARNAGALTSSAVLDWRISAGSRLEQLCAAANCSARRRLPPSPTATDAERRNLAGHGERLRMRIAAQRGQRVHRQGQPCACSSFLQPRFRILRGLRPPAIPTARGPMMRSTAAAAASKPESRNIAPNIASNAIRQYRRPTKAAGFQLTRTQPQMLAQARVSRAIYASVSPLTRVARKPRQSAFVGLRMRIVEQARHAAIENRIAQKFEPLVVIAPPALR